MIGGHFMATDCVETGLLVKFLTNQADSPSDPEVSNNNHNLLVCRDVVVPKCPHSELLQELTTGLTKQTPIAMMG